MSKGRENLVSKRSGRPGQSQEEIEYNRKLAERIEMLRIKARVSQAAMAEALGIERSLLYWYETGKTRIPPYILAKMAVQLGVSLDVMCKQKYTKVVSRLQIQKTLIVSSVDNLPA